MTVFIDSGEINGTITAPASKSILQRITAISSLCKGSVSIRAGGLCDDSNTALEIIKKLGCSVSKSRKEIIIRKDSSIFQNSINCRESGLCLRMFSAILSLYDHSFTLYAEGSLKKRPIGFIEEPLRALGVMVSTCNNYPPVTVRGPLKPGIVHVDGSITSQFITGLLISLPILEKDSRIIIHNPQSKPYIDLTLSVLKEWGIAVERDPALKELYIKGGQEYKILDRVINIEGDWSSSSFFLVAGAIAGRISIKGLNIESRQGDRIILEVLKEAGAEIGIYSDRIIIQKNKLKAFRFDAQDCPDLFPPLVVLALHCSEESRIYGINRLIYKESNRAVSLISAFSQIGVNIRMEGNCLIVKGQKISGGTSDSYGDHRIAMALAISALNSTNGIRIKNPETISKSYSGFFNDLNKVMQKEYK